MPIRQGGMLASRVSTWPRDHFCRNTIAPRRSCPTTWNEFLPISMPITATVVSKVLAMACSLSLASLPAQSLAGREHGRTIPLADMSEFGATLGFYRLPLTIPVSPTRGVLDKQLINFVQQSIEVDWLGIEVVASDGERLLTRTRHGVRSQRNDRNIVGQGIAFKPTSGLPAVHNRQVEVHQNQVRELGDSHLTTSVSISGHQHFNIVQEFKAHLEHVCVVVII